MSTSSGVTIFDDRAKWTELYKNLLYAFCKQNGKIGRGIAKLAKDLEASNSYEYILLIKEAIDEQYTNDELKAHLFYLIGTMKALGVFKYSSNKKKFDADKNTATKTYKKLFKGANRAHLFFNRKKAAEELVQSMDCLLAVCDILIKARVGDIPINDITEQDIDASTEAGQRALEVLAKLQNAGTNIVSRKEIKDARRKGHYQSVKRELDRAIAAGDDDAIKKAQNKINALGLSADDKKQADSTATDRDWMVNRGIKGGSIACPALTDDDTPLSIFSQIGRLYRMFDLSLLNKAGYDKWIETAKDRGTYSRKEDLLNLTYNIKVTPKLSDGYFDVSMELGFTPEQYRLLADVITSYKEVGRLNRICFLPPLPELYDFCSIFFDINIKLNSTLNKIELQGRVYPEKTTTQLSEMLKDIRIVRMLNIMDQMDNVTFGERYVECVQRNEDLWTTYLSIKLENRTSAPTGNIWDDSKSQNGTDIPTANILKASPVDMANIVNDDSDRDYNLYKLLTKEISDDESDDGSLPV